VTAAVQAILRGLVRQEPDLTLVELQQRLWVSERVRVSIQHLWRVLQNMGLRLKKVTPRPRTRHGRDPSPSSGVVGGGKPNRSATAGISR